MSVFFSILQSLQANWRRGHYTRTRVGTGSHVQCLQCDDSKIVTGHQVLGMGGDDLIKVGSCLCFISSQWSV